MIFYFSGTGNSLWAARQLAGRLGEPLENLAAVQSGRDLSFSAPDRVGLVFPVHAWRAPEIVREFAERIRPGGAYVYAVCTCESEAGRTLEILKRSLPLDAGFSLAMPNNYLIGAQALGDAAANQARLKNAAARLEILAERIQKRLPGFAAVRGRWAWLKSGPINRLFTKKGRKTAPFHVTVQSCISCGLCVELCPTHSIRLHNGRPVWEREDCALCLGCLNRCPQTAIEYGQKTQGKTRYYCPDL